MTIEIRCSSCGTWHDIVEGLASHNRDGKRLRSRSGEQCFCHRCGAELPVRMRRRHRSYLPRRRWWA